MYLVNMTSSESGSNDDNDDVRDGAKTYWDRRLAQSEGRTERLTDPDEAGPRDPSAEMRKEAGIGSGFESFGVDDDVSKSAQESLEESLDDWDPLGETGKVEKGEDERISLSLTEADLEDAKLTPDERREALLEEAVSELRRLNKSAGFDGPTSKEELQKAIEKDTAAGRRWAALLGDAVEEDKNEDEGTALDQAEEDLETLMEQEEAKERGQAIESMAESFVEAGGSLEAGLGDFLRFGQSEAAHE